MSAGRVFYTCHQGRDKDIKAKKLKKELTQMKKVAYSFYILRKFI